MPSAESAGNSFLGSEFTAANAAVKDSEALVGRPLVWTADWWDGWDLKQRVSGPTRGRLEAPPAVVGCFSVYSTSNCGGQYDGHTSLSKRFTLAQAGPSALARLGDADDVCSGADRNGVRLNTGDRSKDFTAQSRCSAAAGGVSTLAAFAVRPSGCKLRPPPLVMGGGRASCGAATITAEPRRLHADGSTQSLLFHRLRRTGHLKDPTRSLLHRPRRIREVVPQRKTWLGSGATPYGKPREIAGARKS